MLRRRRLILALSACAALALGACGASEEEPSSPSKVDPPPEVASEPPGPELRDTIAVVDLSGKPAAEPQRLDVSSDATVLDLVWDGWGRSTTTGTGTFSLLSCEPSCSEGGSRESGARLILSQPVVCDGQRYYGTAELRLDDPPAEGDPAIYLDPPCET